jgi:hypothetical protein
MPLAPSRCQRIDHVYLFELLDLPNHWSSQVPNLSNLVARKREQKARCAPPCPGWTQRSRRSQLRLCVRDRCRAVIVACCMSRNSSHVHHAVGSRLADWQLRTVAVDSILLDGRAGCAACDCSSCAAEGPEFADLGYLFDSSSHYMLGLGVPGLVPGTAD